MISKHGIIKDLKVVWFDYCFNLVAIYKLPLVRIFQFLYKKSEHKSSVFSDILLGKTPASKSEISKLGIQFSRD